MEVIWDLMQEWQESWDSWKVITFASLETEQMGLQAQGVLKRLNKVAREVKVKRLLELDCPYTIPYSAQFF